MLKIIGDPSLDYYNRVLAYYLFDNYLYNLDGDKLKKNNKLKQIIKYGLMENGQIFIELLDTKQKRESLE